MKNTKQMKKILTILILICLSRIGYAQSFEVLPLGEIKAEGWIKSQMLRDISSGYISVYDEIQPTLKTNAFGPKKTRNFQLDTDGNWIATKSTWWPGEHEGYFADLVVRNAFLTGYQPWIDKSRSIIDNVIDNQEKNGYIGIYEKGHRLDNLKNGNGELWTQSRILGAILAYYEFTGEKKYLDAVKRAVDYTISRYEKSGKSYFQQPDPKGGGLTHGLMFVDILESLYRLTNDKHYINFAFWLYKDYSMAKPELRMVDNQLGNLLDKERMFQEHAVHVVEHFRVPFWLSMHTDDPKYDKAVKNIFYKLKKSLTPTGAIVTDTKYRESVAGNYGSPYLPYEYCTITELEISLCSAFQKFGDPSLGDEIEKVAFNAGQAARFPNGKAIAYCSSDSQFRAIKNDNHRNQYGAVHPAACCELNAAKLMPYYISNMWLKSKDEKSLVAFLYGPSEVNTLVNGTKVKISEQTEYPFSGKVNFDIEPSSPKEFDIVLRIPSWSKKTKVIASGAKIKKENGFITISKKWNKNDKVEITFEDDIEVKRFMNNDLYVKKGALIYALKIDEKKKATETFEEGIANYDITPLHPEEVQKFSKYKMLNATDINLISTSKYFTYEQNPNADKDYPFDKPYGFIKGKFSFNGKRIDATLVPIGSTLLRKTTFEFINEFKH